jgi:hypothetical protein
MVKSALIFAASAAAAVLGSSAAGDEIRGRTGLPSMKGAIVHARSIDVVVRQVGSRLSVNQTIKLETGGKDARSFEMTWREDDYRSEGIRTDDGRGFSRMRISVDGKTVTPTSTAWKSNAKGDTITRRHTIPIQSAPKKRHVVIFSAESGMGVRGSRPVIEFVAKDLGGFAGPPDRLQVRIELPRNAAANVDGVEPKPTDISRNGMRWVWTKASPKRDIFVLLPPSKR